ncbi:MAG: CHAD domain-containing protein [Pseudomonadota bacterium]
MNEFELKFEIPAKSLARVAAAVLEGKASRQSLQASYFDTPEGALAKNAIVVRVRKEGRRWVQTAKGPTSALLERLEHNVDLKSPAGGGSPQVDLLLHAGTPVGFAILEALNLKEGDAMPALVKLYETKVQRMTRITTHAGSLLEIALDQGRIVSGSRSMALSELEIELKKGRAEDVLDLARQWCADYGLWISSISKSMKGQRLRKNSAFGPAVSAVLPEFDHHASGWQTFTAALQSCLNQILPNASELAGGSRNPEHIHQLRIGIRRLRTAMRELQTLAGHIDAAWEAPMVSAFRELGRHRDDSHLASSQQPQIEAAGGPSLDLAANATDISDPGEVVRAPAFQDALLSLIGLAHGAEPQRDNSTDSGVTHKKAKKMLCGQLGKLHKKILKDGKRFLQLEESRQHDVRKRLKRLRYLAEFAAPLFSARKTKRFVSSLKSPQTALGLYNDEIMALQAYRKLANAAPEAWFGVGWLSARRLPNAHLCLDEIKAFSKVRPFWE